ncbi:hypothetical protein [Helicobacter rodentium]|uniref:hypothetical protein n=1 Tax=Helicobacter rodentium TaxID=59617 RepID=UPI0023539554|nr:hypothetical protein [Helicobacter rodentium]
MYCAILYLLNYRFASVGKILADCALRLCLAMAKICFKDKFTLWIASLRSQ